MFSSTTSTLTPPVGDRDHTQGPTNAPVTLLEFGDYECPYCGTAEPVVKDVQQAMGDHLRFAFRNFPLPQHPYAEIAAEAAEAAGAQGKFWQMHDLLYQHQNALAPRDLVQYAQQLGLDVQEFEQDLQQHKGVGKLRQDIRSGEESGVQGTPTFFINGEMYQGELTPRALLSALRQAAGKGS